MLFIFKHMFCLAWHYHKWKLVLQNSSNELLLESIQGWHPGQNLAMVGSLVTWLDALSSP